MVKEKRKEYAGTALFQQFYQTGDISKLFAGYDEYRAVNSTGFIGRLRFASGGHHLGNEFAGVEYEMKFSVKSEPSRIALSPVAIAESVHRTFNGMKRYLVDGVVPKGYTDVHYFGADKEVLLLEEGPPQQIKQKKDLRYMVNMRQTALITKRREVANNSGGGIDDVIHSIMYAARAGATYPGRAQKGKADVDVLDTKTGRVYVITASETNANNHKLFQVEVEYKGFISAFANKRPNYPDDAMRTDYENEEQVVEGIAQLGKHVRRRIAWDKKWSFLLEPTDMAKYQFIKNAFGDRSEKMQAAFEERFELAGSIAK